MALINIPGPYTYEPHEAMRINRIRPWNKNHWKSKTYKPIRDNIREYLLNVQNGKCCYCGLNLMTTSATRIDHFVRQSGYNQFIYEPQNLVGSCQYCNEERKKTYNTIQTPNNVYARQQFKIVHPILDNPAHHIFECNYALVGLTQKGRESIRLFDLTATRRFNQRRLELNDNKALNLNTRLRRLFTRIRNYRR